MSKTRMEAFSDAVVAILITIMVLQLQAPLGTKPAALVPLIPIFLAYVLSFTNLAIYWNNHHHLLQAATHVDGLILWANMHLLFWLSLVPFVTAWVGENPLASWPLAIYGLVLLAAGIAYTLLTRALVALHGRDSILAAAVGRDVKGVASLVAYMVAILLAFIIPWLSIALYALVAVWWLVPDRRIERRLVE